MKSHFIVQPLVEETVELIKNENHFIVQPLTEETVV